MPEKQKPRDRKELHTILAAFAMTLILTLWNAFATHDRQKVEAASPSDALSASVVGHPSGVCIVPAPERNTGAKCMTVTRTRSS